MIDGEASENPIDVAAARWPKNTVKEMEEIFQYFDETMSSGDSMLRESVSQAIGEAVNKCNREWIVWLGKIFLMLDSYSTRQGGRKFIRMSFLTMGYVLGFGESLELESLSAIARKLKMPGESGKQAVNKCAGVFLDKLQLAPMLSGRTVAARAEMEAARIEQVKSNQNKI